MRAFILLFFFVFALGFSPSRALALDPDLAPRKKPDNGVWRIGYMEGGHYNDYPGVLRATAARFAELGWIPQEAMVCARKAEKTRAIWDCLTGNPGEFLAFLPDAHWSADWKAENRKANKAAFLERAATRKDIDLMFAFGTWAGQDLANNEHSVPTVVCSTSNAVASGIVKSAEDSGFDHVHARVDPTRYERQVRLFHSIVNFKRLGVVYEDSTEGRSYAGIDQIAPLADELGFQLVPCLAVFSGADINAAQEGVLRCHEQLAPRVDAMYITIHRGVNDKSMTRLLKPFFKHYVPTFAMGTLFEVNCGALMSMAQPSFTYAGDFYADVAARILHGRKARELSQILPDPQNIRVNFMSAKLIGFDFPLALLSGAEDIVEESAACGE